MACLIWNLAQFISILRLRLCHHFPGDAKAINNDPVSVREKCLHHWDLDLPALAQGREEPFGLLRSFNSNSKRETGKAHLLLRLLATAVRRHNLSGTYAKGRVKDFLLQSGLPLGRVWTISETHHEKRLSFNRLAVEVNGFLSAPIEIQRSLDVHVSFRII